MECRDSTDHGTQAGLVEVSVGAEALAEAGVEVSADAGSAGARAMADAGAGQCLVQAGQAHIGAPHTVLFTGRMITEERRCV